MRTAILVLIACAAIDLVAIAFLLGVVWATHRRMRKEAAAHGEAIPSAAGQFGCLFVILLAGLIGLGAAAAVLLLSV